MEKIRGLESALSGYAQDVAQGLARSDFNALAHVADTLLNKKRSGARIFIAGNGGSAATASHMANDLVKGCRAHNRPGFNAQCLSDSQAIVTCLANDFDYESIYAIQLDTFAHRGDVLVVYSGSGNSPNIVRALEKACDMGITTIGFLGRDGGAAKPLCDIAVVAPDECMERIEDMHMLYEHALATILRERLEDEFGIETVRYPKKTEISAALFDFDGTVSLIREGWQEIMIPYFTEVLLDTPNAEDVDGARRVVREFVDKLTGKQTIFQCMQLDEEVVRRGGPHREPLEYKREYLRRLNLHIADRKRMLAGGQIDPAEWIVPGFTDLAKALKARGARLYLASGTDEADVLEEARLLGVDKWFDGGIYGALDDITDCSKELVIRKLLEDNGIPGERLLSFGDGYVEIELVAAVGGYAVGVATDEVRKKGINDWKRGRLLDAGAHMIIPDFSDAGALMQALFV